MRWHTQNLSDGRQATWRHGRGWFGPLHVEWSAFHTTNLLLAGVWWRGFNVYARWFGLFIGWGDTDRERAGWQVSWSDGTLRLSHPWVRQNEWRRADPWWKKDISLRIVDWLIGRSRCETIAGESHEVVVPMPEGSYRATVQHETRIWRRRWYWPESRRDSVYLDIPRGIPFAGKGESAWDCGDDGLFGISGDSVEDAVSSAVRSVMRSRRKYGHDSNGTGRTVVFATPPVPEEPSR